MSFLLLKPSRIASFVFLFIPACLLSQSREAIVQSTVLNAITVLQPMPELLGIPADFTSNLPLLIVKTLNNQSIWDSPKTEAYLGIVFNGGGEPNSFGDAHNHYSGAIGIELRGNSTQGFPKKPYEFETRDSVGENLNVSLFGWPEENDFILRASYLDHTFIRNSLAMEMSRRTGRWASRCHMVELFVNDQYMGIYVLMEKIKADKGRLDIAKLDTSAISEPDISGGYIFEITGFGNQLGQSRELKYPDFEEAAAEQIKYISDYDNAFRNVMRSSFYKDEILGYSAWIDVGSFVDELIVQEAMRNSDAYGWSGYFHKDKDQKLFAGPVWDFDQSAGNSSYPDNGVVGGWLFSHPQTSNTPFFWPLLFKDPVFAYKVRQRWEFQRDGPYKTDKLIAFIDSIASDLTEAQVREFKKWPVLGVDFWRETTGYNQRNTYQKEVDYLKTFLIARWDWMDNELSKIENPDPTASISLVSSGIEDLFVYPNPATDFLVFRFDNPTELDVSISIYNQVGMLLVSGEFNKNNFPITISLQNIQTQGLYFYKVSIGGSEAFVGRFVKIDR